MRRLSAPPWRTWGLVLVVLTIGLLVWEVLPPGIWHDDGVYVLLGRAMARGEGLRYVGVVGAPPAPKFPPLYPLLLAPIWRFFPAFPQNALFLSGMNLLILVGAASVFLLYLERPLGLTPSLAWGVTLIAWASPQLWRVALVPLSEPLFLLVLLLALVAGARMERRRGWGPMVLFLLAATAASYTRSLGVALIGAGALSLCIGGRRRAAFWLTVGATVLLAPWFFWSHHAAESIPGPLLDTLGPYGGWWIRQAMGDPTGYVHYALANAATLLSEVLSLLLPGVNGSFRWLGVFLLPPLIVGLIELFRATRLLVLTLGVTSGVLLLWPFQALRLLVPFQPILILIMVVGFRSLWLRSPNLAATRAGVGITALAWALALSSVFGYRMATGWPGREYGVRAGALMEAVEAVEGQTPGNAVVGAPELWAALHLFTGRLVVPSARFTHRAGGGPIAGTPEEQQELWIRTGVTHLVLEQGGAIHGAALARIEALCQPGSVRELSRGASIVLVALDWDSACKERVLGSAAGSAMTRTDRLPTASPSSTRVTRYSPGSTNGPGDLRPPRPPPGRVRPWGAATGSCLKSQDA